MLHIAIPNHTNYGPFKTYQVPLQKVADVADLKFSRAMLEADVFGTTDVSEMVSSGRFVEIMSAMDLVLTRPKGRRKQ